MKIDINIFIKDLRKAVYLLEEGQILSPSKLANIISSITFFEVEEGGPYAVKSKNGISDTDIGLNLLIAYFLLLCDVELSNLNDFLDSKLKLNKINSIFFTTNELSDFLECWNQLRKGKIDEEIDEIQYTSEEKQVFVKIMELFEERFAGRNSLFKKFARKSIDKTIKGNYDKQMSLMAFYTKQSLGKNGRKISNELIAEMGLVNIFFWTAFIIYDDFWDEDESADSHILPTANLFSRHYVDFFICLFPKEICFRSFFHKLMDNLDEANTWETVYCRTQVDGSVFVIPEKLPDYEDYENKYRPASGHILGPVSIFLKLGYKLESKEVKNLISYFRNYLIAMQLNDDAHDWEEDMSRGHLSTVVVLLLKDLKKSGWKKPTIDLVSDKEELKKVFWFTTIKKYSKIVKKYSELSQEALRSIDILENISPLLYFPKNTLNVANEAERERKNSVDFLNNFNG